MRRGSATTLESQSAFPTVSQMLLSGLASPSEPGSATIPDVAECLPRYRPHVPILVGCDDEAIARRFVLYAGVRPFISDLDPASFALRSSSLLVRHGLVHHRDRLAFVLGGGGSLSLTLK